MTTNFVVLCYSAYYEYRSFSESITLLWSVQGSIARSISALRADLRADSWGFFPFKTKIRAHF
jgi:hypothetical protein